MPQVRITARQIAPYVIALSVGIGSWLLMNYLISSAEPWSWNNGVTGGWIKSGKPLPQWFIQTREEIYKLALLMALTMATATFHLIPFVLWIVRKHPGPVGGFEFFLGLSPLLYFLPTIILGLLCVYVMPIQLIAALLVSIKALLPHGRRKDVWAFPGTLCWFLLFFWYGALWWGMVGD